VNNNPAPYLLLLFPFFFAAIWLAVTTLLSVASGWVRLARAFPDHAEEPLLRIRHVSGMLGLVSLRNVLHLSAWPSGLRVGMNRLFCPFSHDFLVPWSQLAVIQESGFFRPRARLAFGNPAIGTLILPAKIASRLADAAAGRWSPEGRVTRNDR
jgi:hypothetical protein